MERLKMESLVCSDRKNNSNKFYIIELLEKENECIVKMRYGRLGKKPIIKEKPFVGRFLANKFYNEKLCEKKKKYTEVPIEDIIANGGEFFEF